jgi:hypothetical protein
MHATHTRGRRRKAAALSVRLLDLTPANIRGETFTRASSAYETGSDGILVSRAADVLRRSHYIGADRTLLLEGQRTNLLPNSTSTTSQVVSLAAGTYTLSAYGDSASASGAVDGAYGSATNGGTGATPAAGTALTFTVSILQDVTITPGASIQRLQVESGSFASSYIATAGATASRAADSLSVPFPHAPQAMTVYIRRIIGEPGANEALEIGHAVAGFSLLRAPRVGQVQFWDDAANPAVLASVMLGEAVGDLIEERAVLYADGGVLIGGAVNKGAETVSAKAVGTNAVFDWSNSSSIKIGRTGTGTGFNAFRNIIIARGEKSLAYFRARAA